MIQFPGSTPVPEQVAAKALLDYVDSGENDGFLSALDVLILTSKRDKIEQDFQQYLAQVS